MNSPRRSPSTRRCAQGRGRTVRMNAFSSRTPVRSDRVGAAFRGTERGDDRVRLPRGLSGYRRKRPTIVTLNSSTKTYAGHHGAAASRSSPSRLRNVRTPMFIGVDGFFDGESHRSSSSHSALSASVLGDASRSSANVVSRIASTSARNRSSWPANTRGRKLLSRNCSSARKALVDRAAGTGPSRTS